VRGNVIAFTRKLHSEALRVLAKLTPRLRVRIPSRPCGFFGNFFITLNGLMFCDSIGAVGVPWWDSDCPYLDPSVSDNAWSMFFRGPPSAQGGDGPRPRLAYYPTADDMTAYQAPTPREAAHRLMKRFAEPHPEFLDEADAFVDKKFRAGKTLGVHVRGTDARRGLESRRSIPFDTIHDEIAVRLRSDADTMIFLASDEAQVIADFKARYGERVCHRECARSVSGESIHGHYDSGVAASGFEKGRDVLIDALLLSRVDFLIRTHSAVTTYSLCRNLALPYLDLEIKYLNEARQAWLHERPSTASAKSCMVCESTPAS
jgi:hypothetical protein